MKMLITTLLLLVSSSVMAQQSDSTEAYFKYLITVESDSKDPEVLKTLPYVQGSTMEIYCTSTKSRMDMRMGQVMGTISVVDRDKKRVLTLNSSAGGKFAMYSVYNDEKKSASTTQYVFTGNKTKKLGYNCEEVIALTASDTTFYWITQEIDVKVKDIQMVSENLPGFPVSFSKRDDQVVMTFELIEHREYFKSPWDEIFFLLPPAGYKIIEK